MSDTLVEFRFEVPVENICRPSRVTWGRFSRFMVAAVPPLGDPCVYRWDTLDRDCRVYVGRMPQPQVTALQALAMGHDLDAVLDMLGVPS